MEKTFNWYNVTVQFETEDEKSGKIKKVKENYLYLKLLVLTLKLMINANIMILNLKPLMKIT